MKILVTGSKGQLGTDVVSLLKSKGHTIISADLPEADITDKSGIQSLIEKEMPDAVIHLAAFTAVDKAESERELCGRINAEGTSYIAEICGKLGIKLLYTSTDYVFEGNGDNYSETDSPVNPCNYYGLSKLQGEEAIKKYCEKYFIVRISWVFGPNGKNFVYTMLRLAEAHDTISVVDDQIGSPTYTPDLSALISEMIVTDKYGVYHATNEGICSWAQFAQEIMKQSGKDTKIIPIKSAEYPTAAVRPLNSRLSKSSLDESGFSRLPDWKDALARFMRDKQL